VGTTHDFNLKRWMNDLLNFINVHLANSKFYPSASGPIITSVFRNSQRLFFVCAQISQRSLICPTNLQESSHYKNLRKSVVKLIDTFVTARKSSLRDLRILCRSCYGTTHDGSRKTSCEHHHWRHCSQTHHCGIITQLRAFITATRLV
jgi:hypothetical protein